jgi:hypothetical protein
VGTLRTTVLVEHENPRVRAAQAATLEAAGFDVAACSGPAWQQQGTCPLVAHGYCHKAFRADVIVNELPLGHLHVYVAQRAHLPDCPVLLGLSKAERARHPILDSLATTIPRNPTGGALLRIVWEAVPRSPADP